MKTPALILLIMIAGISICYSQTQLKYYGVDDIDISQYSFLRDSLKCNFALVELPLDTTLWKSALSEAEKNNLKLIIWPLGDGERYLPWKFNLIAWDWDISEGMNVLKFAERYVTSGGKSLLAVVESHEPFYSQKEMVFTSSQLKMLYSDIKSVAPDVNTFIYMNDMALYDSTNTALQMSDGIMDICGTYRHCFGTQNTEEEALNEIDADRALIDRKGLHMQLIFAIQCYEEDPPEYVMPTAAQLKDFATKVLEKHELDGVEWYPWNKVATDYIEYLSHDRYDSLGADRWGVVSQLSSYLTTTGIKENEIRPTSYSLSQNYPNPFNPSTTIEFSIPESGVYSIIVYNLLGKEVAKLFNKEATPGNYKINLDGSGLSSGIYFYVLRGNYITITKKMLLLK